MTVTSPRPQYQSPELPLIERRSWTRRYEHLLQEQLLQALTQIQHHHPMRLQAHLESLLTLLNRAHRHPALHKMALELIVALHPWPLRWLRWEAWEANLRFALQVCTTRGHPRRRAEILAHLAALLLDMGKADEALNAGEEALRFARTHGLLPTLAAAADVVVPILLQQGRSDEARHRLDQLVHEIAHAETGALREKTEALARLHLQQLTFLRRENRLDEAVARVGEILEQLEDLPDGDGHLIANAYAIRATMTWAAGRYPEAVHDMQRAIRGYVEEGDTFAEIQAWGNLGLIYYTMTEFDLAEAGIRRVITLAERLNARWHIVYAIDYLGAIHLMRGERHRAVQYFDRALELARQVGVDKDRHRIRSNRAVAWLYQGKYKASIPALEADLAFSEEQGLHDAVLMDCICLSLCYRALGEKESPSSL